MKNHIENPIVIPRDSNESRDRELDQLCRFAATLGTTFNASTLLEDSLEPLIAMAKADGILIALASSDAHVLEIAATRNLDSVFTGKGISASQIATLGTEAVAFDSLANLHGALSGKLENLHGPFAIVPLWAHAHLRGVAIIQRSAEKFSSSTLKLLTASGRQLALAVENSQLLMDLQQSYRKLMDTQEELIRAERLAAIGQLSATMAHEIRNPLATIFSAISQIRKHSQAEGITVTLLDIADEEAMRLNSMVSGLLEFARPRKPCFETRSILEVAKYTLENQTIPENIICTLDDHAEDAIVLLDPDLIQRAITILVENSVQSLGSSGGTISVNVRKNTEGEGAFIEVSDTGSGISKEVMGKVFEPFFSTKPSGTGLGLPIVKRIAEDHSGTVKISTEIGRGTTVRLLIKVTAILFSKEE